MATPPRWLTDALPDPLRSVISDYWLGVVAIALSALAVVVFAFVLRLSRRPKRKAKSTLDLREDLDLLPQPPPLTGDRRLLIEGTPARIRCIVLAPAGAADVSLDDVAGLLENVVPGIGAVIHDDRPVVRKWPRQVSEEGFVSTFFQNMQARSAGDDLSPWIFVAGRAHVGTGPAFLGLALQSVRPSPIGKRRLRMQDWTATLRVRTRD